MKNENLINENKALKLKLDAIEAQIEIYLNELEDEEKKGCYNGIWEKGWLQGHKHGLLKLLKTFYPK